MTADDLVEISPRPPAGGRRRVVAVGAVVAVLAAGGGVAAWAATRGGEKLNAGGPAASGGGVAIACPAEAASVQGGTGAGPEVPENPTASGTDGRLVPTRTPGQVVVCEYDPAGVPGSSIPYGTTTQSNGSTRTVPPAPAPVDLSLTTSVPLTRSTGGGDSAAVGALTGALQGATVQPAAGVGCAVDWVAPPVQYLVGLSYDDGDVWIATPDSCAGVTNGVSRSDTGIGDLVTRILDDTPSSTVSSTGGVATGNPGSGTAPSSGSVPPPSDSASPPSGGTTGPGEVPPADPYAACTLPGTPPPGPLVPFTPTAVTICHLPIGPGVPTPTVVDRPAATAVALADQLGGAPALAPDTACPDIAGPTWRLLFTDDAGDRASVLVDAGGCRTASNGVTVRQASAALLALLQQG